MKGKRVKKRETKKKAQREKAGNKLLKEDQRNRTNADFLPYSFPIYFTMLRSHSKVIHRHTFIRAWSLQLPVLALCTPVCPSSTCASQSICNCLDAILEAHCRLASTPLSASAIAPRYDGCDGCWSLIG